MHKIFAILENDGKKRSILASKSSLFLCFLMPIQSRHYRDRSNRIVATKDPFYGKLVKVKRRKGKDGIYYDSENTFAQIPEHCYPMNSKITKYKFEEIKKNLDYAFYLDKIAEKLDINWVDANGNAVDKFSY